jgi:hypothetical protein
MGALLVKLLAPQFQAILIDAAQAFQFQTDIAMQAFVRSVVLGMPGAASLQIDAQGYPPSREPAQAVYRVTYVLNLYPYSALEKELPTSDEAIPDWLLTSDS